MKKISIALGSLLVIALFAFSINRGTTSKAEPTPTPAPQAKVFDDCLFFKFNTTFIIGTVDETPLGEDDNYDDGAVFDPLTICDGGDYFCGVKVCASTACIASLTKQQVANAVKARYLALSKTLGHNTAANATWSVTIGSCVYTFTSYLRSTAP